MVECTQMEEETCFLGEEIMNETIYASFHRRGQVQMVNAHKDQIKKKGSTIVSHEMGKNGDHVIHHVNGNKRLRVSTISQYSDKKGYKTKIHDRPGTAEEQSKHGVK